jgi:hypothetical protein
VPILSAAVFAKAGVAICRNKQSDAKGNGAFGNVLPVRADGHAPLAMTSFFEPRLHERFGGQV